MPRGALARLARVEELALLRRRFDFLRELLERCHLETDFGTVVTVLGARPDCGTIVGMQEIPQGGDRAIVQIGSGSPDAVQRRGEGPPPVDDVRFAATVAEPSVLHLSAGVWRPRPGAAR